TSQVIAVPSHAPVQRSCESLPGVADSRKREPFRTTALAVQGASQAVSESMRTVPSPPATVVPSSDTLAAGAHRAITAPRAFMVNWHEANVPEQSPDQPVKTESGPGVATRVAVFVRSPISKAREQGASAQRPEVAEVDTTPSPSFVTV